MFVALGLTVELAHLSATTWRDGAILAVFLALVARPLVVVLTLARARLARASAPSSPGAA